MTTTTKKQYTLLFYNGMRSNPDATLLDWIVAKADGGKYSHVEIVTSAPRRVSSSMVAVHTVGCHLGRGGVSTGYYHIDDNEDDCLLITVEVENSLDLDTFYSNTSSDPYSIIAALRTKVNWLPDTKGWCCSTWIAREMNLADYDFQGVENIRQWALTVEVK